MRVHWRNTPISGHQAWRAEIGEKNDQPGRSAPVLAQAWSGPVELYAALSQTPELADLVIESIAVEVQTSFDSYDGPRNHDLVVEGDANGAKTVICIEAKAGESLGAEVSKQARDAAKAKEKNPKSHAPDRLTELLRDWTGETDPEAERVRGLRYQLFTAAAGTVSEARKRGARQTVLIIHDFLTDERPSHTRAALEDFVAVVFPDSTLPDDTEPWCTKAELPAAIQGDDDLRFFLAHAVSDFRPRVPASPA